MAADLVIMLKNVTALAVNALGRLGCIRIAAADCFCIGACSLPVNKEMAYIWLPVLLTLLLLLLQVAYVMEDAGLQPNERMAYMLLTSLLPP